MMKITHRAIELIKRYEGLRLDAYLDAVNVPTIGYGHTHGVVMGTKISAPEAEEFLRGDLEQFETGVAKLLTVTIRQSQFDALVSFAFNLGLGNFKDSTLRKHTNDGKPMQAAQEFPKWINAGGKPLLGLLRRRLSEALLYLEDL